jgi:eukaryotic-like serine/threonine-protein kinase
MNPGDLLRNRYRIEKPLAAGGFGETYLAIDLDYPGQRQVVVKHLKPASNDPGTLQIARRLFESEAQVLAELGETSDQLPALYAYFEEQGEFYLVQEFIAGQTLTAELAGRQLSEAETIEVLQEILAGLAVVHSKNKIHRDLKPDNIIRRAKDGKLVLIDFGAVKEVRQAAGMGTNVALSASIGIGTQGYMPTEQAIGFPRLASDVYAVGAIGIQCLTGKHPHRLFDETVLALRWQHLCQTSPDLAVILEKMVAQNADDRYFDGAEAAKALDQFLNPPQAVAVPSAQNNHSRRNFLKWWFFSGVGAAGVMALSKLVKNSSTSETGSLPMASSSSKSSSVPQLTKIQFTSVKLDSYGKVVDRPKGQAKIFTEDLGDGVSLTMVKIPAGKFKMGSPANNQDHSSYEKPQHLVTVPEFFMGQMLVTKAQWYAIMGKPFFFFNDDRLPIDTIPWIDAMNFCQKLSQKTGRTYRLPSEAEWEYACRAGTTTPFAFGENATSNVVNYNGNYPYIQAPKGEHRGKTTAVGSFPPNLFGLHDMHGNLWEWCLDEWVDSYNNAPVDGSARGDVNSREKDKQRLVRGGAWSTEAKHCRSAERLHGDASAIKSSFGLRVVAVASRNS